MNQQTILTAAPVTHMTGLRIYLFGPLRITRNGVPIHLPRRKTESLLAYLVLHPEAQTRDYLAALFWGDTTDDQARHSLRTALASLRREISPDLIIADREQVQLDPDYPLWVDLQELMTLEKLADHPDPDFLQMTLTLWQGDFLAGLYDEWVTLDREHYSTRLLKLCLQLAQNLRAASEYAQAIHVAQRVLAIDPANEHAHQHLMFCYVASGDRSAALRQYELCERALEEELDASPSSETTALYHWIKQFDGDESSAAGKITNLPIPLTSFVGRTRETAEVKQLLSPAYGHKRNAENGRKSPRLLTLTGAGGSGKTRLAIQVATDLIDSFDHGVWWVELAELNDGGLVSRAVAKTLGVREVIDQGLSQSVANFLGDKQMLLVIDNCEHLVEPCAEFAAALLGRCPHLQILTTSREPLNIAGEALWPVPAFSVPDLTQSLHPDLLQQFESLRLFVERAATVQPGFTLTPENVQAITEICHRLDGIPLAIELAAARVKVLAVEQIAAYLNSALGARFALLTQGSRVVLPRHQTLRATIDWSYDLLDEEERLLFRQLAVFRGGFTLEMLERIVASPANSSRPRFPTILDLLSQLVDKSLVIVERHGANWGIDQGAQNRYRLLETLREYALEQFASPAELKELQQQHANVFFAFAEVAAPEMLRANQHAWLNRLEAEHDNLRTALEYLLGNERTEKALRLATALQRFWDYRGHVAEGRKWLSEALANRATTALEIQAKALNGAGWLAYRHGDLGQARQLHEEALFLYEQCEEGTGIVDSWLHLARLDLDRGEYDSALQRVEQSLELCRELNYEDGLASSFSRLGNLAWDQDRFADASHFHRQALNSYQMLDNQVAIAIELLALGDSERMLGNLDAAHSHYEECLKAARTLGHKGLTGASLKSLGLLAFKQGEYEQARAYGEEALRIFRTVGDKVHSGFALSSLGGVARKFGEFSKALTYYSENLQIMFSVGYKWPTFYALEDIAVVLTDAAQHPEAAVRFLGAAGALREETGLAVAVNEQDKYERVLTSLRQKFGVAAFESLWQQGYATPLAQTVAEATGLTLK